MNVVVDLLLMTRELRMNKLLVQDRRAFCHWAQQPENDANFDFIIEWKPRQKHIAKRLEGDEA